MIETTLHIVTRLLEPTMALIIVLDPFGLLPLVVALTGKTSIRQRQRMLTRSVLVAFVLLMIFVFGGLLILKLFRITLEDLSVAGGLLLLIIALNVVIHGHVSPSTAPKDNQIGIVPIASPLLVGPGSIATVVLIVGRDGLLIATLAVTCAFFITWLVLRGTSLIYKVLGVHGSDAIARIMGVLLAAYATGLIREGVTHIVRGACGQ